jgi:hypothetical protein
MNKQISEIDSDIQRTNDRAARRSAAAKSRMRKYWKLLRARRRSLPSGLSVLSALHSTDRYQMSALR